MSSELITALVSVVVAIIGLAALATVLSPKATTASVITAGSQGFANDLVAATSPVTGASGTINTGGSGFGGLTMPALPGLSGNGV